MTVQQRFSGRVDAYRRSRPSYPQGLIEHLTNVTGLGADTRAVDVGAGTGILTALLADTGARVWAVEPNADMVAALRESRAWTTIEASAESIPLEDHSIDLLTTAQAFHWLDADLASAEFRRILTPVGYAAVIWNERRLTGDPFLEGYEALLREYGVDYAEVSARYDNQDDLAKLFGRVPERASILNTQSLDQAGLHLRVMSCSYMPKADHPRHRAMLEAIDALFEQCRDSRGRVTLIYDTQAYIGRVHT